MGGPVVRGTICQHIGEKDCVSRFTAERDAEIWEFCGSTLKRIVQISHEGGHPLSVDTQFVLELRDARLDEVGMQAIFLPG